MNPLLFLLLLVAVLSHQATSVDFLYNSFNSTTLLLYGSATVNSNVLTLTNDTTITIGRALYPHKIPTKAPNSSHVYPFSTSFIFAIAPYKGKLPGHGFVLLFVPFKGIQGATSSQNLGLFNRTNDGKESNHVVGIEFDVFANQEFNDINDNHVGVDVNSLTSVSSEVAGYWEDGKREEFKEVKLNSGGNYQVWIDYNGSSLDVTMAPAGLKRPIRPLLSVSLELSGVFEEEMYVGFTASTGVLVESHKILSWSFSNSDFAVGDRLITTGLPSFVLPGESVLRSKGFIAGVTVGGLVVLGLVVFVLFDLVRRKQRRDRERAEMEEWELEYWPHRIAYQEIEAATGGFRDENVIGVGGNGKVYKGVLQGGGGGEVAVKRISHENDGMREFLAEISSLGRLKHRNLVALKGWCKREKGVFMLVYEYMENGSLDKMMFDCDQSVMLSFKERIRILKDVASGVLYLHEGWEAKVLHRDIKASNVLLDKDMNGRLGDFGLARMHAHGAVASTTRVVGTVGYMAPEVVRSGRASVQTDVFGFGVLILEVMCGKRPIAEGEPPLVQWVWELMMQGKLLDAVDPRLKRSNGELDEEEAQRVLHLGLLCAYPNPGSRPSMRQVVKVLEGKNEPNETVNEDIEAYLLQQTDCKDIWSKYYESFEFGVASHPTFDDLRQSISKSVSLSWTNSVILEGR